ncbi:MAG: LysR family transcriptional regulator [Burkholderiaceae bacterium]
MDLHHLRTFVTVAEEQHLTRAAERLHISQPAASAQIKSLERSFGIALFDRTSRGLELTRAGRTLMSKARRVLAEARDFNSLARELSGQTAGELAMGSNNDPTLSRIAQVISELRETCPLVGLSVQVRSSAAALQGVRIGELDAAFLLSQGAGEDMRCVPLRTLDYRVCGPAAWRERIAEASWAQLAALPWITTSPGNAYARMLDRLVAEQGGVEVNSSVTSDNDIAIRAMIEAGIGISLVRADLAELAERAGRMAIHPYARTSTQLVFVHLRDRDNDPLLRSLASAVRATWPEAWAAA